MKKFLFLFLSCFFAFSLSAQQYLSIKGKVLNEGVEEVKLFKTVDGKLKPVATTTLGTNGTYGFLYSLEEPGFYALGSDRMNFPIYLQAGEEVNIDLDRTKAILNGKNTKENKALYAWEDYSETIRTKSIYFLYTHSNYKDFFPAFEEFMEGLPAFQKKLKSGNAEFDQKLQDLIKYDIDFYATSFLFTPRSIHPTKDQWPAYFNTIVSNNKFKTDAVLDFPMGIRMLSTYVSFSIMNTGEKIKDIDLYTQKALDYLHTPRLKGEYIMGSRFERFKSYDQYLDGMKKYGQYLVTPSLKARAEAVGTKLYDTKKGGIASDFTYPDVNGKNHSLSDFKGKVVLVDVWATWCGPCKKEIPHLIKLEKEMHGTDLVVLGVSLDEAKDKQKWIDFVKEKGLGGVQVNASGWSKITKDYKITGIPRFMVFDKKGNIVTTDAPRPSNPALKKLLEEELQK